jgi:hypothetical protein
MFLRNVSICLLNTEDRNYVVVVVVVVVIVQEQYSSVSIATGLNGRGSISGKSKSFFFIL